MNEAENILLHAQTEIKLTPVQELRFWAKVNKSGPLLPHMDSPCWEWTAFKNDDGYGKFRVADKPLFAHRISWMIARGPIPHNGSSHGICVCHRCDNRACVNPLHLRLGTHTDNMRDMENKGRQARGDNSGSRLHPEKRPRGESHARAKLTSCQVVEIRTVYASGGIRQKQLAARFGVSETLIYNIISRKLWKHI